MGFGGIWERGMRGVKVGEGGELLFLNSTSSFQHFLDPTNVVLFSLIYITAMKYICRKVHYICLKVLQTVAFSCEYKLSFLKGVFFVKSLPNRGCSYEVRVSLPQENMGKSLVSEVTKKCPDPEYVSLCNCSYKAMAKMS